MLCDSDAFYRAINPTAHMNNGKLSSAAFSNEKETDGMSVDWAELSTPKETADRFPQWPCERVACIPARSYWNEHQCIEFAPTESDPAHSHIVGRKTDSMRRRLVKAATTIRVGET